MDQPEWFSDRLSEARYRNTPAAKPLKVAAVDSEADDAVRRGPTEKRSGREAHHQPVVVECVRDREYNGHRLIGDGQTPHPRDSEEFEAANPVENDQTASIPRFHLYFVA